jgi:PilZ domain
MTTPTASTARQSLRRIADGALSIEIEPKNKAIVLNISDGGLGFRALNPVAQTGTIRFSFLDNGKPVEASADLVWTDGSQKTGGLSFASTPVEIRERFQNWANHGRQLPRKAAASETAVQAQAPPPMERAPVDREAYRPPAPQVNAAPTPPPPPPAPVFSPAVAPVPPTNPRLAMLEASVQRPDYGWYQETTYPNPSSSRFFSGFLTGIFLSIAAVLFVLYSDSARELRTQLAARIGLSSAPAASPQESQPAPDPAAAPPAPPSGSPAAAPAAPPETPALPAPSSSAAASAAAGEPNPVSAAPVTTAASERPHGSDHASTALVSTAPKIPEPGAEELARAERYLSERPGPSGAAAAAPYLWDAVKQGNIEAEITLAELYSRGEGVGKSCDQARVLLRAAAHKGSVVASDELAQIIRNGCR